MLSRAWSMVHNHRTPAGHRSRPVRASRNPDPPLRARLCVAQTEIACSVNCAAIRRPGITCPAILWQIKEVLRNL